MDDEDVFDNESFEGFNDGDVVLFKVDETNIKEVDYDDKEATVEVIMKVKCKDGDDRVTAYVKFDIEISDEETYISDAIIVE